MSTTITFNGSSFVVPAIADASWGTTVSNYLIAISTGSFQKTGGTFTLTAEANFGATYGFKLAYLKSQTANIAAAGFTRLAKTDTINWRNNANSADVALGIDTSDNLTFAGTKVPLSGLIVNADIAAGAAIAYSKLALTGLIVNADIASAAAIAYAKLVLTGSVVNADISTSAAIAYSKLALTGLIVNADIGSAAAIAYSKLALSASIATGDLASGFLAPIAKGGTGQTTANAALNALLPDQSASASKVLSTDGTNTSWASAASSSLNQNLTDIGNASNARTATNTALLGDVKASTNSQTATVTIAAPGVFTSNGHGMANGDKFYLTTTGALPTGLTASTTYYAANVATNTFNASTSYANALAGTYITTSGSQSGTHTLFSGGLNLQAQIIGPKTFTSSIVVGGNTTSDSNLGTISSVSFGAYFESTVSATFTGPFNSGAKTIVARRTGRTVTLEFPVIQGTSSAGSVMTAAAVIPSGLRPAQNLQFPVIVEDSGAAQNTMGYVQVTTAGTIEIGKTWTSGGFTSTGACGPYAFVITYTVA